MASRFGEQPRDAQFDEVMRSLIDLVPTPEIRDPELDYTIQLNGQPILWRWRVDVVLEELVFLEDLSQDTRTSLQFSRITAKGWRLIGGSDHLQIILERNNGRDDILIIGEGRIYVYPWHSASKAIALTQNPDLKNLVTQIIEETTTAVKRTLKASKK